MLKSDKVFLFNGKVVYLFDNLEIQTMKNILFVLTVFLFLSCSSDDSTAVRKITFKANGVYKVFEDIEVTYAVDNSWEVPFARLDISANPIDGRPETFGLRGDKRRRL